MSYVHESRTEPPGSPKLMRWINGYYVGETTTSSFEGSRYQYGWRSGITDEDAGKLQSYSDHSTWGDTLTLVQALERIEYATTSSPRNRGNAGTVNNDRDYQVREVANGTAQFEYVDGWVHYKNVGHLGLYDVDPISWPPDEDDVRSKAGALLRNTAPTRPDMDLAVSFGELIQAKGLLIPRGKPAKVGGQASLASDVKLAGSAHLWANFGIVPTARDIASLCEAVINMDSKFDDFVRASGKLVKRKKERVLDEDSIDQRYTLAVADPDRIFKLGPCTVHFAHADGYYYRWEPAIRIHVERKKILRAYCTWEYFVGDPNGYLSRKDAYLEKAKRALGGGITASSIYALTPYSWLLDWCVDFGSILAFQQQVADYSLTWRNCGFVVEENLAASAQLVARPYGTYTGVKASGEAYFRGKRQMRRGGSPYSLKPGIPSDPKQIAILGALGLSKFL